MLIAPYAARMSDWVSCIAFEAAFSIEIAPFAYFAHNTATGRGHNSTDLVPNWMCRTSNAKHILNLANALINQSTIAVIVTIAYL